MTRGPHPDPDALSPKTREVLASLPGNNVFQTLAHADAAFPPLMALTASLWNDAELGQRMRGMAVGRKTQRIRADQYAHRQIAEHGRQVHHAERDYAQHSSHEQNQSEFQR